MPIISIGPAAGTDDGYWANFTVNNNSTEMLIGFTAPYHNWLRCPNTGIPQGSVINSATLVLYNNRSSATNFSSDIYGVAADSPTHPASGGAGDSLVETTAFVNYVKTIQAMVQQ